jgi:hypothetical protein
MLDKLVVLDNLLPQAQRLLLNDAAYANIIVASTTKLTFQLLFHTKKWFSRCRANIQYSCSFRPT